MCAPLDTAKQQIRLLHLNLGDDGVELSGAFGDAPTDIDPDYEAIPYVWGT